MERMYKKIPVVLAAVCMMACTKGFDDINANPNEKEEVAPEFLLSTSLVSTAYDYQKDAYWDKPASAGRYITLVRNEGNDKFDWGPQSWDGIFNKLSLTQNMLEMAEKRGAQQYVALGKILKAFNFAYATDLFGDMPYSEALQSKGAGVVHPKYDEQKDIYPALLKELSDANDLLAGQITAIDKTQDVMYAGNALSWRKFANSLRLRMLLRISKNYPTAFTEMQAIINDANKYPIFTANGDNAEVKYLGDINENSWPGSTLANDYSEFDKRKPSKEIVDALLQRNDPRLGVWIAKVEQPGGTVDNNAYVGVPNAIPAPYDYNGGATKMSRLGTLFTNAKDDKVKAAMMTYAEVCFILAEALQAGKITVTGQTAETMYYKGIRANMAYYGVEAAADGANYFNQASVKYNGTLKQLIEQKWIAMFLKGAEGWFDHRRTGFPQFVLGPLATGGGALPKRYIYPDNERAYNENKYQDALSRFGADKQTTLMWYLK
ncbi:SusD/RagB family nutrient-binding outer membrane lipoprotein [Chitinophaga lutea]